MKKLIEIVAIGSNMVGLMEEQAREQFNLLNLTLTQMHYLETMNKLDNPSLTELAATLKLSKPTVKVAVDKLVEKDFVIRVRSDEDRRSAHLHLTEKGKLINTMHEYAHKRIAESISRKLNEEEQEQFILLMEKILNK
ncbi:MAG: MarR family transcriptional regulator [Paludibacter sp.]|nr:MarR family transcriptional regulator [Paludibacter sp.]